MSVKAELSKSNINENISITKQGLNGNVKEKNNCASSLLRETKSKYGVAFYNKSTCYNKNMKLPHSKRKFVPVSSCLTDTSAKVVLSERNIEIKDLECKVKFLKNKIRELENENKTLRNIQSQQGRELKKFKEGITDIPSLLKSHKEESKVYESTISSLRKELRECQKEIKLRNENLLKKENLIYKLNVNFKQNEELIHEFSSEIKVLKTAKTDLEEENKMLVIANENLKNEKENLCKQIKDLTQKTHNLEDDLSTKSDLNKNLNNELNELKEKYEKELLWVSNDKNLERCKNQIHCETADGASSTSKVFAKNSSVDFVANGIENVANSVAHDVNEQNLWSVKPVDKTKDALIHTFKSYQNTCNSQQRNSACKLFETRMSNYKLLPPLKTQSKESSTSIVSNFEKRKCFSASAELDFIDRINYQPQDLSTKESQGRFTSSDYKIDKSENKANVLCDSKMNKKGSFFNLSLIDDNEDWQDHEFNKEIQCIKETDIYELQKSQNNSFALNCNADAKNCEGLSKPLRIRDYLGSKNVKENAQNILERNNTTDTTLEKKTNNYFIESSETMSKSWQSTMNGKKIECKSNEYKADNPIHRSTFLKQPVSTKKPMSFFNFDEIPEQKSSGSQFELLW